MRPIRWGSSLVALWAVGLTAVTCTEFPRPAEGSCGNFVREGSEDCDLPVSETLDGLSCDTCHWICGATNECPTGLVCEAENGAPADGPKLCRKPSLTFVEVESDLARQEASAPVFTRVGGLLAANLDGKGPMELVVQAGDSVDLVDLASADDSVFVGWFDEEGHTRRITRERDGLKYASPIASSRRSADGAPDSLFVAPHPRVAGVLPLNGSDTESMLPGVAPQSGGLTQNARLAPVFALNDSGTLAVSALFDGSRAAYGSSGGAFGVPPLVVDSPFLSAFDPQVNDEEFALHLGVGRLDPTSFEVLVAAVRSETSEEASHVRVYYSFGGGTVPFLKLTIPAGTDVALDGGAWIAPLDGDEFWDVLVVLTELSPDGNFKTHSYISYGVGNGEFTSSKTLDEPDQGFQQTPFIFDGQPLAVGLIDGDERADFVFAEAGIALSAADQASALFGTCPNIQSDAAYVCGTHDAENPTASGASWTAARIVDLNGDGTADVVASGPKPAIDVYLTIPVAMSQEALLSHHEITSAGAPQTVVATDLDGDLVKDLVFHTANEDTAALFVAFGATSGGPEPPVKVLEATEIVDVESYVSGLMVLTRDGDSESEVRWSLVAASTERQLISPFLVPCFQAPDQTAEERTISQQLAAGRFSGKGRDAALLYEDCFAPLSEGDRLLLLPGTPHGGVEALLREPFDFFACEGFSVVSCPQVQQAFRPPGVDLPVPSGWSKQAFMVPIDLDADGRDEIVLLGPDEGGGRVVVARTNDADPPRFVVEDEPIGVALGGAYDAARGSATAVDVNGDSFDDVVVLTTATEVAAAELVVLLNHGAGSLDIAGAIRIPVEGTVRSLAVVDMRLDGVADDLLLGSEDGVRLATLVLSEARVEFQVDAGVDGLLTAHSAHHLVAADFDGDNLVDFAISDGDIVRVFRSVATNP